MFLALIGLSILSCKKDDPVIHQVKTGIINDDNYTGEGTLSLLYSIDAGETFSKDLESVADGTPVIIKVNNGIEDLTTEGFSFDWAATSPSVDNKNAEKVTINVNATLQAVVTVADKTNDIQPGTINDDNYTEGGTLTLLYSSDGGTTFSSDLSSVPVGSSVIIKVNNGTEDLTAEDFSFDWSGTTPSVDDNAAAQVTVTVNTALTVSVAIADVNTLIVSSASDGQFYTINSSDGALTSLYPFSYNGSDLLGTRGFVYHYGQQKYYVTTDNKNGGGFYTIDPATKLATFIDDENSGPWNDAMSNLVVMPNDSIFATNYTKIFIFGTDGNQGREFDPGDSGIDFCCGQAMVVNDTNDGVIIASDGNKSILLASVGYDGTSEQGISVDNLIDFPSTVETNSEDLYPKAFARATDGSVYVLLFNYDTSETYFAQIDFSAGSMTYISTFTEKFNTLASVPNYLL